MAATILIVTGVGAAVFFAARKLVKDRKSGGCAGCAGCGAKGGCARANGE